MAKNEAKAKQHPEAELLIFENYLLSSPKNNRRYSKKMYKNQTPLIKWGYMINDNENKAEDEKYIT